MRLLAHRNTVFAATFGIASLASLALEGDASACGGCFTGESNTVVTDHRMILSVSSVQTTLYDQIRYQGSPSSFAWVLPISGEAKVALSADALFSALDNTTQTQVFPPPLNCPPPPRCAPLNEGSAGSPTSADGGASPPSVIVTHEETVGPYATVQLSATNPTALTDWLAENGYKVPNDVKPVIAKYVEEQFSFLAMKLIPGATVTSMRPVRVTTLGASPVLPLRMVAAGTGPVVGITLWVAGEGRYAPRNFPSFTIDTNELIWDWSASSSNYRALRTAKTAASDGRAWETETSIGIDKNQIRNIVQYGGGVGGGGGGMGGPVQPPTGGDYLPVVEGGVVKLTSEQARDADLATFFTGIAGSDVRVTRLRADLKHASLDQDLFVTATDDQSVVQRIRQVTREANQPQCPIYRGCETIGTAPREEAQADAEKQKVTNLGASSCAASGGPSQGSDSNGYGLAFAVGVVFVSAARGRRKQ